MTTPDLGFLGEGPFLSTEVLPPDNGDPGVLLEAASAVRAAGAGPLFFPDAPGGRARVDATAAAAAVRGALGGPCIPHVNTRDRNRIALQAALETASFLGVDGVKAVTGDPVPGDLGRGVYDLDSVGLVQLAGRESPQLPALVGHALGHTDPGSSEDRLRAKLDAGAAAVVTTPTLDPDVLLRALDRLGSLPVPLLVGLTLVPSAEVLDYLLAEAPAFRVPPGFRERLHGAHTPDEAHDLGLVAARAMADALSGRAMGFHVVPPFGRWQGAVPLLEALRG